MTEGDWNSCTDPRKMLDFLLAPDRATDRKLRLFAVAFCRQLWELLSEECYRQAVEVSERHADGKASTKELTEARKATGAAFASSSGRVSRSAAVHAAFGCAWSTT